MEAGEILWTPGAERIEQANLTAFGRWLERERGLSFASYAELWRWSVEDLEAFWGALWDYFGIKASSSPARVLGHRGMPGAEWFPGARLNYAENVLLRDRGDGIALLHASESRPLEAMSRAELAAQVRILGTRLRALGVRPGDRVVAWMPNIPQTLVAMLATAAIGAIWACCSPDFGERGVLDRFAQLAPKVLFCIDGYRYGGKPFERRAELERILAGLPSLQQVIHLPYLDPNAEAPRPGALTWSEALEGSAAGADEFRFEQVPFAHPLWTLFSSGTTGLPKAIVHGHGGILLETRKNATFHFDLHPGERLLFFTTTGWMLWNFLASTLATGAIPILYDGSPAYPAADALWKLADDAEATLLGASPTYVEQMARAGIVPRDRYALSRLRSISLAGSPATPGCMAWFHANVKQDLWVANGSGGTDCCTGFVGGVPTLPVRAGEIQAPSLGVAVAAFNDRGESVVDEVGELVITAPLPSMPVGFWNDPDGRRYRESYFEQFPGIWRHGDFFLVHARGGCAVLGRSDATLNRYGIRIGTAEIYRALAAVPEIEDGLIINLDLPGGGFFMPLFVKLAPGATLEACEPKIRDVLRREYSSRHVPDKIIAVPSIPMTLTGKKMEVPVRRILLGMAPEQAANASAMLDPKALDVFVEYAAAQRDYRLVREPP